MASRRHMPATFKRPIKPGSRRGLDMALQALYGPPAPISTDDALAERERFRVEDESREHRQPQLPLQPKAPT